MLTVAKIGGGRSDYYMSLAAEDYYVGKSFSLDSTGYWLGQGSDRARLDTENFSGKDFRNLFDGYSPERDKKWVYNAGLYKGTDRDRMPGYDLCFSAPKSVSLCWAIGKDDAREAIEAAHQAAVEKTIAEIEKRAQIRYGKGGKIREEAGLIVAVFQHGTARQVDEKTLPDMQLHSHAAVINTGIGASGKTAAINGLDFLNPTFAKEYGAVYRNHLANGLIDAKFELVRKGDAFEIKGVSEEVIDHFSKRTEQIEKKAPKETNTYREQKVENIKSRVAKREYDPKDILNYWNDEAAMFGFTRESVEKLRNAEKREITALERLNSVRAAANELAGEKLAFTRRELTERAMAVGAAKGIEAEDVREMVGQYLKHEAKYVASNELEGRPDKDGKPKVLRETVFTTAQGQVAKQLEDEKQAQRLEWIEDKAFMLKLAKEKLEGDGYRVMGVTWSNEKAEWLNQKAGIESYTVAKLLSDGNQKEKAPENEKGTLSKGYAILKDATWQSSAKARKHQTGEAYEPHSKLMHEVKYATGQISRKHRDYLNNELKRQEEDKARQARAIDEKTVLVVHADKRSAEKIQMQRLVEQARQKGAMVVFADSIISETTRKRQQDSLQQQIQTQKRAAAAQQKTWEEVQVQTQRR